MLLNYIKIAIRNILKNKLHSFINIIGLSIGIACAIILLLTLQIQLSWDRHNSKHDRIYMVHNHFWIGDTESYQTSSSFPLAEALKSEYPSVEESVRLHPSGASFINSKDEIITENGIYYADPSVFKVFDHIFIHGGPEGALDKPNTIVLSETLAKRHFGQQNPVGKILHRNNGVDYTVTGVFKDLPVTTSFRYTALIPIQEVLDQLIARGNANAINFVNTWGTLTFILLKENAGIENIIKNHEKFIEKYYDPSLQSINGVWKHVFQPLTDYFLLRKATPDSIPANLWIAYLLSSFIFFILIIACINYINLTTARSMRRAREVGIRKLLGSHKTSLVSQFLNESMLITIISVLLSFVLIEAFLPLYNKLLAIDISFNIVSDPILVLWVIIITLVVGFLSGSYPAFFLSSFLPIDSLRGSSSFFSGRGILRKILVIIQFAISIIIIISALIFKNHTNYLNAMDLGYSKDNIMVVTSPGQNNGVSVSAFKEELLQNSNISSVAESSITVVAGGFYTWVCGIEDSSGELKIDHKRFVLVDFDFIDLMGMEVIEGRSFNREMTTDIQEAFLVNEALVKEIGWKDSPIGKQISMHTKNGKVIGVLKDFHLPDQYNMIFPMIIVLKDSALPPPNFISIKIHPENTEKTIEFIREKWAGLYPTQPFNFWFLNDMLQFSHQNDIRGKSIFFYFAFLCIFISCIGLFGLSSFIAENKTNEIAVRKVHGASVWNILYYLFRDFLKLIIIASLIAWPVAFFAMDEFMAVYPYTAETNPWIYILSTAIALLIAILTISYHGIKAALTDPVKALRYE